jgi:glycosyltransferase involved in cell wall biosynthesis
MIESMACGTPTIAFRCGSVPEIIRDRVTGYIVDSIDQAAQAVKQVAAIDRAACRAEFERRFTAGRMARDYVKLYESIAVGKTPARESESDQLLTL